jgi:hypothetical protein
MKKEFSVTIAFFIFIIVVFLIIYFEDDMANSHVCRRYKEFKQENWYGTISNKYINSHNHNAETFELKKKEQHVMFLDDSEYYKFITVGDSVFKQINTNIINVYRKGKAYEFEIDFDCND